jgi:hypothetical protein
MSFGLNDVRSWHKVAHDSRKVLLKLKYEGPEMEKVITCIQKYILMRR